MSEIVIAQLGPVAAYEIKTANVTLYSVACSRCGRQQDYRTREQAVEAATRHAWFCAGAATAR